MLKHTVLACLLAVGTAQQLVFTEYVEGSGYNKAVEIANTGTGAIDFGATPHQVVIFRSGATLDRSIDINAGVLAPGEVLVVSHSSASGLPDLSALTIHISTGSLNFNGDDSVAIVLASDPSTMIDMIGARPMASDFLKDVTLRRRSTDMTPLPGGFTAVAGSPYEAFPKDDTTGLGKIDVVAAPMLVFTEYVEGSGYIKAVEIVNSGTGAIDFGATPYQVLIFRSGAAPDRTIDIDAGVLAPGEVLVVSHSSASGLPDLSALQIHITTGALNFNGDDSLAIVLASEPGTMIDMLGARPMTSDFLKDVTLRRRSTNMTPLPGGFTAVAGSPYVAFSKDDTTGLGCAGLSSCDAPPTSPTLAALRAVRASVPNPTGRLLSWVGDDPCDGWQGVQCNGGVVQNLHLNSEDGLAGVLPDLSGVEGLLRLYVQGTGVTGFAGLPQSLVEVDLSSTPINGALPAPILALPSLMTLRAANAGLTGAFPVLPDSVRNVQLQRNQLSGEVTLPASILNFMAYSNQLSGALPPSSSVLRMVVGDNAFTGGIPAYPSLVVGQFQYNKLAGVLDVASTMPVVEYIDVSANGFGGPLPDFASFPLLHMFEGHSNAFTGGFPLPAGRVMRKLVVSNNRLSGAEPTPQAAALVADIAIYHSNPWDV